MLHLWPYYGTNPQRLLRQQQGKNVTTEDITWAAGFFEGEGHINCQIRGNKSFLAITIAQVDRRPLDKFANLFGGKVYGPYGPYTTQKKPFYQYTAYTIKAEEALNAMMPYLFHKGEQATTAINKWKDYCENRAKNFST